MIPKNQFIEAIDVLTRDYLRQSTQIMSIADYFDVPTSNVSFRVPTNCYRVLLNLLMGNVGDKDRMIEKWVTLNYPADETGSYIVFLQLDCGREIPFRIQCASDLYEYFQAKEELRYSAPCDSKTPSRFCTERIYCGGGF